MEAKILRALVDFAERLDINSNQAILIYIISNDWLNPNKHETLAKIAVSALEKVAAKNELDLWGEAPYILQLIERGIIHDDEAVLFGWRRRTEETSLDTRFDTRTENGVGPTNGRSAPSESDRRTTNGDGSGTEKEKAQKEAKEENPRRDFGRLGEA